MSRVEPKANLRRTHITPQHIETGLRVLFFASILLVVLSALFQASPPLSTATTVLLFIFALGGPALVFGIPRRYWSAHQILLTFIDLALVSVIYYLTGGNNGDARFLLYIVVSLAATRLVLENALIVATLGSMVFSTHLIVRADNPIFLSNLYNFIVDLLTTYAFVFIVHFAVTGQREAEVRREKEQALSETQRLLGQQQMLVQLSRDITSTSALDDIMHIVLETIRQFVNVKGGSIALVDPSQQLYIASSMPPVDDQVRALRLPLGQGIVGQIAQTQQPFYSPDLDTETRVPPAFRNVGGNARIKSFLGVPLSIRGHCIGVLQVDSAEPHAFTPDHQRILETVAAQVSGAIENARLLQDRREFSRHLQEIYRAANELSSHFDLDYILEEFAQRARELLRARYAAVAIFNEERQIEKFVTVGVTPEEREQIGPPPHGQGLLAYIFNEQKPVRLDDLTQHSDALGFPPQHPAMHSLLAVPLISRGETQGTIYLTEKLDGQHFTVEDEELLLLLASGASAAISNARLYVQLRHNIEQLYALHQIGQAIGSSLSQEEVIRVFNLDVRRLCGAEASVISEWNSARNDLVQLNSEGPSDLLQARGLSLVQRQLREAARTGQALSLSIPSADGAGISVYGYLAPLTVRGQVIGLAEIYSQNSNVITSESSSLFLTLTAQLAVSMENARLYTQLQKREQQLRNFVGRLFQAEDGERRRMAYEIHDGLAQLIVSADIHLSNFASLRSEDAARAEQQLEKGLQRLKASLTEVRRVVSELRPSTLDDFGLINTLRRHVEQLAAEQGWDYTFEENLGEERLDPTLETGAFRIVQESLNNIRKYSKTDRVAVELKQDGEHLRIRIQDWGQGFDLEEARQREGHFGLSSMEERTRLLGGWFEIETHPGRGTLVQVALPCYRAVPTIRT